MKILVPVALLVLAGPTLAAARDGKPVDPNQRICKAVEATGSRFTKKTCHTRAEWAQLDKAGADAADEAMKTRRADSAWPQ